MESDRKEARKATIVMEFLYRLFLSIRTFDEISTFKINNFCYTASQIRAFFNVPNEFTPAISLIYYKKIKRSV